MARGMPLWTTGSLFALVRLRGRQVGRKRRPSVHDKKKAPALARKGKDELEMKIEVDYSRQTAPQATGKPRSRGMSVARGLL